MLKRLKIVTKTAMNVLAEFIWLNHLVNMCLHILSPFLRPFNIYKQNLGQFLRSIMEPVQYIWVVLKISLH